MSARNYTPKNTDADDVAAEVEKTANDAQKTMNANLDTMTAKAESMMADTQKTMTDQVEKFSKGFEGMTTFGQENLDAFVKSSEIAAKAAEGINSEITSFSKKAFEDGVAAAQDFASAKSVTELFEKQTAFAKTAFEGWVSQATRMNEIVATATKDITAPIGARVSAATGVMKGFNA